MDRPTTDLILPHSKVKVVLHSYLTIKESRELKKIVFRSVKMKMNGDITEKEREGDKKPEVKAEFEGMDATFSMESQDLAFKFLVKEVYDKDGKLVENPHEYLENLPSSDADTLFDQVDQITNTSSHSEDTKKN